MKIAAERGVPEMWLKEKIKNMVEEPEDEIYEDEEDVDQTSVRSDAKSSSEKRLGSDTGKQYGKVVHINTTANLQVYVVKPEQFNDVSAIADLLRDMRIIVLNLETANRDIAHRVLDFLVGVAYAYNGQIKRIANNTFLIAPYNVKLMGNLLDDLQSSDWNMPQEKCTKPDTHCL